MHTVYKQHRTDMTVEVLFKTQKSVMLVVKHKGRNVIYKKNEELMYPLSVFENNFDIYIEPRKEYFNAFRMTERTLSKGNVTETRYQGPFNLEIEADHRIKDLPRGSYYGRLIMTHHSETEVTVEFHLKR